MAASSGRLDAAYPGLVLKAWALCRWDGSAFTLVKGSNIASVSRASTGVFTFNFSAAMAGTDYLADVGVDNVGFTYTQPGAKTTGSNTLNFLSAGSPTDPANVYVAFYE